MHLKTCSLLLTLQAFHFLCLPPIIFLELHQRHELIFEDHHAHALLLLDHPEAREKRLLIIRVDQVHDLHAPLLASDYYPQLVSQVLAPYIELTQLSLHVKLLEPRLRVPCHEPASDGQHYQLFTVDRCLQDYKFVLRQTLLHPVLLLLRLMLVIRHHHWGVGIFDVDGGIGGLIGAVTLLEVVEEEVLQGQRFWRKSVNCVRGLLQHASYFKC